MHIMWHSPPSNLVISGHRHFVKRGTLRRRSAVGAVGATGQQPLSDCRLVNGPPETLRQLIGLDLCVTDSPGYIGLRMVSNLLGLKLINTQRGALLLLCCFIGWSMKKCLAGKIHGENEILSNYFFLENYPYCFSFYQQNNKSNQMLHFKNPVYIFHKSTWSIAH